MHFHSVLSYALGAAITVSASLGNRDTAGNPSATVYECPKQTTIRYNNSVPPGWEFPETEVVLCYTADPSRPSPMLNLTFKAYDEEYYYVDPEQGTNDDIWLYTVMEVFMQRGIEAPQTYLEFDISPSNVTYQAFIYNPSRERAYNAPFDHAFLSDPLGDGMLAETILDRANKTWVSTVQIPLALFNVPEAGLVGTQWRMNFFRTITSPTTFPQQRLGAWSPPNRPNFHITSYFGYVQFQ
ncbi:hypothetical protein ACJ72_06564 [Emergomyces africanus]|uniref:Carbohydrate-binding domain-containing protein n=1 Tax=Emergomyces africanus TaxID=1955775 RepID=A0A1B7NQQ7_9EURO|nr:hypothetical protein ACJ72_06564 [Emergomyces africanus]